jgi:DNA-directed RNA polymerase subunit RPC12/RpoP
MSKSLSIYESQDMLDREILKFANKKRRKERNNILLIMIYKYKIMTDKKIICIDCGKQFNPKSYKGNNIVCEDCIALLKRRFWSSIKMGKVYDDLTKEDKHNEQSENSHSKNNFRVDK